MHVQLAAARGLCNERDSVIIQTAGMAWTVWDLTRRKNHASRVVSYSWNFALHIATIFAFENSAKV